MTQAPDGWVTVPFTVFKEESGLRLDRFLAQRLKKRSRSELQRLIAEGSVFLRGRAAKAAARIAAGETVSLRYPRREEPPCPHASLPVLYEDDSLLAVSKPAGILSHPTDRTVLNTVTSILKSQFPGSALRLAHRLDRDTSGVLLLAKSAEAAKRLQRDFLRRRVQKEYLAIVRGRVPFKKIDVALPIGREGLGLHVRQAVGTGAPAQTEFVCLGASRGHSLLLARPKTGRLHQIRVHLAFLGFPLLNERLYGDDGGRLFLAELGAARESSSPRQMLHAHRLSLNHPMTSRPLAIEAPVPDDFRSVLKGHGLDS